MITRTIFILILSFCASNFYSQCPPDPDFDALIAFYNSTDGSNWVNNSGWADGASGVDCNPCNWLGVSCYTFGPNAGRVQRIDLFSNNLNGTIDPLLAGADAMQALVLFDNPLLTGPIPSSITSLNNLSEVILGDNNLSGPIPTGWQGPLSILELSNNNITGIIPPELIGFEDLFVLRLDNNQLTGSIPNFGSAVEQPLEELYLNHNSLTGSIPASLGNQNNLPDLIELLINDNQLSGCYDPALSYLCAGTHPNLSLSNSVMSDGNNFEAQWEDFCSTSCGDCSIFTDFDNDGFQDINCGGDDCDDNDPTVFPGAQELCDNKDNDCNGLIDDGVSIITWFFDGDFDSFGDDNNTLLACSNANIPGYIQVGGDCNDLNSAINPAASEICDGIDNNCNGQIDEGFDADGDGFTSCGGDCDDNDNNNYPGNPEICDGQDNDCDGLIDEGFDLDGDGVTTCAGDCDDNDNNNFPGNAEVCDGQDNDCNGLVDEGFDIDNDGFTLCAGDCDDNDNSINPGAVEVCDGIDNNCDGTVDEGFDSDADGIADCFDNCPDDPNPLQEDSNNNGIGDACETTTGGCTGDPVGSTEFEYIESVTSFNFNNISGDDGGYADYTNFKVVAYKDDETEVTVTPGFTGTIYDEFYTVWVDWNKDNDFDDAGELVFQTLFPELGPVTFEIQAPSFAFGETIMRIQMGFLPPSGDPCEINGGEGETEDYSVFVIPCSSEGKFQTFEYIEEIVVGSFISTTGNNNGYYLDLDNIIELNINQSIPIALIPGFTTGVAYNEFWRIWIDLNFDGNYDNSEIVFQDSDDQIIIGNFDFPSNQSTGVTTMRIAMNYKKYHKKVCKDVKRGEVEDYVVNLTENQAIENQVFNLNELYSELQVGHPATPEQIALRESEIDHLDYNFLIFPNPVDHTLSIAFQGNSHNGYNVVIIDMLGNKVKEIQVNQETMDVDVGNLPRGHYLIRAYSESGFLTKKFIKM